MLITELNIGDYVYSKKNITNEPYIVDGILKHSIITTEGKSIEVDDLEPVKMNQSVLLSNGFTQDGTLKNWYSRMYGKKHVTVCLHVVEDNVYGYDFWINQPWGVSIQTKISNVWNKMDGFTYKLGARPTCADAIGVHILQHAYTFAEIEEKLIIK